MLATPLAAAAIAAVRGGGRARRGCRSPFPSSCSGACRRCSPTRRGGRSRRTATVLNRAAAVGVSQGRAARRGASSTISSAPTDHWLIPDNLQENRRELVAHRTSPTNIGLQLLSTLAAYDFGYLTADGLLDAARTRRLRRCCSMPRYRGHFYNWYDTRTLAAAASRVYLDRRQRQPCRLPRHASRGAARHRRRTRSIGPSFLEGLEDLVDLVDEEVEAGCARSEGPPATCRACGKSWRACASQLSRRPSTGDAWKTAAWSRFATACPSSACCCTNSKSRCSAAGHGVRAAGVRGSRVLAGPGGRRRRGAARRSRAPAPPGPSSSSAPSGSRRLPTISSRKPSSSFLFDEERQLFSIGFNVVDGRLDASYYDTLASEARLASFLAIATGKISHEHWFRLGRSLTPSGGVARAPVVERVDVRVPDAAARHAHVSRHAAARDLRRRRPAADPVRRPARRAVGHLRVGVSRAGSRRQLSIPRLRRARARAQARAGRRPGDRAVRELPRCAAGARRGARQPRAPARGRRRGADTDSTKPSTTPSIVCRRIRPAASSCRPTWPTTRA